MGKLGGDAAASDSGCVVAAVSKGGAVGASGSCAMSASQTGVPLRATGLSGSLSGDGPLSGGGSLSGDGPLIGDTASRIAAKPTGILLKSIFGRP
jgi:hypothetical protein